MKLNSTKMTPYLYILPFFILFLIFGVYPIGYSAYISFFKWGNTGAVDFVGLRNYSRFFGEERDPLFWISLKNTLILLVTGSLLQHFISLPLAIFLNRQFVRGRDFFKTVYFLPYITSAVSVAIIFQQLYNPTGSGPLNFIVNSIGFESVQWLRDPVAIKASISIILNWRFIGYYTIIYMAGLQGIPSELYEAARIDGASEVSQHLRVTVPLMIPIIFFSVSMSLIFGMQLFAEPYMLCGDYRQFGGVQNSGLTLTLLLMTLGFRMARFGRAAAVSWLMFFVILTLTFTNKYISDKLDYTKE